MIDESPELNPPGFVDQALVNWIVTDKKNRKGETIPEVGPMYVAVWIDDGKDER